MTALRPPVEPPPNRWALPDAATAPPGIDLVGVGADLEPGTLLAAYRSGLFPMHVELWDQRRLGWWSPDPRGVLPLDGLRVTRSLRRSLQRFTITVDTDPDAVMAACSRVDDPVMVEAGQIWIDPSFRSAYRRLFDLGWVHSIEVRGDDGALVGGLYGVAIGGLFAGESMFHRERDASKAALVALVDLLSADGDDRRLLDVQWATEHLVSMGAIEVPRVGYLELLDRALQAPSAPGWARGQAGDDTADPPRSTSKARPTRSED